MLNPESPLYPFIQNRKVVVLSESNRAEQAAKAMRDQDIGAVVVADNDGHMTGIVTDRDLVCELLADDLSPETPLSEIMSPTLCGIKEDASVADVVRVMTENGVRRVPILREITDGRSRCLGIITLDDLIVNKAVDTAALAEIVSRQVHPGAIKSPPRRPMRKARRMEQTLTNFTKAVARETGVPEGQALDVAKTILSYVVRRVTSREAAQLISQLPHLMQDELLDQEAGPDRSINAEVVIQAVRSQLQGTRVDAAGICRGFWRAMGETVTQGELGDVYSQLPKDMQELFVESFGEGLRASA